MNTISNYTVGRPNPVLHVSRKTNHKHNKSDTGSMQYV